MDSYIFINMCVGALTHVILGTNAYFYSDIALSSILCGGKIQLALIVKHALT